LAIGNYFKLHRYAVPFPPENIWEHGVKSWDAIDERQMNERPRYA
jgi:hypothetical protein